MDNTQPPNEPVPEVLQSTPHTSPPAEKPISPPSNHMQHHTTRKPMFVGAIAVILVILAGISGVVWMSMSAKRNLQEYVQNQVKELTVLEQSYKSVRTILDEKTPTPEAETTTLLKARPTNIREVDTNVLGAEEDLNIAMNRKLSDQYKKGRASLRNLTTTTTKISSVYQGNPLVKPFLPDATSLISKTKDFTAQSDALLVYLNQINTLEISSKTLGYQIGLALQESIMRNADTESVTKFKSKVNELNDIYADYKSIDISALPQDLQKSHNESLASFDKDVAIFSELVTALERKNALMLQQAIRSLIIQGESASAASEIEVRNFWNEHETINQATTIKQEWQQFGEDKLGIAF